MPTKFQKGQLKAVGGVALTWYLLPKGKEDTELWNLGGKEVIIPSTLLKFIFLFFFQKGWGKLSFY